MQKKLIAVAVAGLMSGAAFAQSNVTISGLFRMSLEQTKLTSTAALDASAENRVTDNSSMLVFSGREDLGGGMYAGFNIDNRFSGDLGAFAASGNTNVHVGGNWGRVAMGRQDLHYGSAIESYKAYTLQNILSNGIFAQVNGTNIANTTRTPNVVMYDSPNMSGFSARLAGSTKWNAAVAAGNPATAGGEATGVRATGLADPGKGSAANLALNYANGPIKAGYSYWKATVEGGNTTIAGGSGNQRGDTLQFGYTFPMGLAIGIGWNKSKLTFTDGDQSRTAWVLPVSYAFGANQVNFTYAKAGNTTNVADSGANAYTLAYSYSMSKRTNVGVSYTRLDNKSGASYDLFGITANGSTNTVAGQDVKQMAVNLLHSF